jgi:hypothetical protein
MNIDECQTVTLPGPVTVDASVMVSRVVSVTWINATVHLWQFYAENEETSPSSDISAISVAKYINKIVLETVIMSFYIPVGISSCDRDVVTRLTTIHTDCWLRWRDKSL